jgi:integrase/recombinase XerD
VPAVRASKQARVPSVWDPGQVARILAAIDRSNPCGKRDYAIIVLIARLGLRTRVPQLVDHLVHEIVR